MCGRRLRRCTIWWVLAVDPYYLVGLIHEKKHAKACFFSCPDAIVFQKNVTQSLTKRRNNVTVTAIRFYGMVILCSITKLMINYLRGKSSLKGETSMKTEEELNALREEVEALNKKLAELTEEELKQVTGGIIPILFA